MNNYINSGLSAKPTDLDFIDKFHIYIYIYISHHHLLQIMCITTHSFHITRVKLTYSFLQNTWEIKSDQRYYL